MNDNCSNCQFVKATDIDPQTLKRQFFCLRWPPQSFLIATPQGLLSAWGQPQVQDAQWCGEHVKGESLHSSLIVANDPKAN